MKRSKVNLDQVFLWLLLLALYAYLLPGIIHRWTPEGRREAEVSAATRICSDRFSSAETEQFIDCYSRTVSPLLDRGGSPASSSNE